MTYKVFLIPPNLRKNETIVQIADSLELLSNVLDDIMLLLEKRIESCSNKINSVTSRLDIVDRKIVYVREMTNAVQVFSSSKYLAIDLDRRYCATFPTHSNVQIKRHDVSHKCQLKKEDPLEKLHVYHVQLKKVEPEKIEGLGKIPNDVICTNDLLLYNCGKNLYKEFTISDSLKVPYSSIKAKENKLNIGMAPASIGDKMKFSNPSNQTYFYSPDLGEVPSFDIPLDLPDLPGVADNVRYHEDNNSVIAPSVALSSSSSNLIIYSTFNEELEGLPEMTQFSSQEVEEQETHEIPQKIEENVLIQLSSYKVVEQSKPEKSTQELPVIADERASLMEAIRKAGGAKKLRSISREESITKSEKSSGDLMADLHLKLAMRRKGISGTQPNSEKTSLDSRGALTLMSALIPSLEEANEEPQNDDDDEWE